MITIIAPPGVELTEEEERQIQETLAPLLTALQQGVDPELLEGFAGAENISFGYYDDDEDELSVEEQQEAQEQLAIMMRGGQRYLH